MTQIVLRGKTIELHMTGKQLLEVRSLPDVYQLPNGKWRHKKSNVDWDDEIGARADYRFCLDWEPDAPA